MDEERECRHLPEPVFNLPRCPKCGALVRRSEPVNARLLAAAKWFHVIALQWGHGPLHDGEYADIWNDHVAAIADAEPRPAPPSGTTYYYQEYGPDGNRVDSHPA